MNLLVQDIIVETHDTKTLILVNQEEGVRAFDYQAGQYLTFRFDDISEKPVVRSYTMSSSPLQQDFIAVTVKEVENGFVSLHLCRNVKKGDVLRARGPIGRFGYDPKSDYKHLFMIAGGSGVTPFISLIRELQFQPDIQLSLLVSYRSDQDLICWDELTEFKQQKNVKIYCALSRQDLREQGFLFGRIDSKMLDQMISSYQQTTFFCCGPEALMTTVEQHLKQKSVDPSHIKTESFAS